MITTRRKIALARIALLCVRRLRRWSGRSDRAVVVRGGLQWDLDLNQGIDFSIYLLGAFEPRTVRAYRRLIRPGDTILDVGANIGAHTLFFAQCAGPAGRVVAFEPTAYAYAKLLRNLQLNGELARRVDPQHVLLVGPGAGPPPDAIFASWPLTGGRELHPKHGGEAQSLGEAASAMLDEFLAARPELKPTWIKIDVDGNELPVLSGARETLRRFRPRILMELSPYTAREAGYEFGELVSLLTDAGYGFSRLDDGRPLPAHAAALDRYVPDGASINVLLTPR